MANKTKQLGYLKGCARQLISLKTILLIAGVTFCICLDTWNQIPFLWSGQSTIDVYYYLFNAITYGGTYMPYLMPVLAASAYATSYVKESSDNMKDYLIGRSGYFGYALGKITVSTAGGGLVAGMGVALFCGLAGCLKPLYIYDEGVNTLYYTQPDTAHGYQYILILIYLSVLSGMLWSMVSLLCSAYFENIYIAMASPLLLSYLLCRIYIILDVPDTYRLDYWLSGRSGTGSDTAMLLSVAIRVLVILLVMADIFYHKIKKQGIGGRYDFY